MQKVEVMSKTPGSLRRSLPLAIAAVLSSPQVQAQPVAAETPQTVLAAQIRIQGFTCDKALGATRYETIKLAVLPHARNGIVGATMLGLGRALGAA